MINDRFDGFFKVVNKSFFGSEPVFFVEAGFVDRGGVNFNVCSTEDFLEDPARTRGVERGGDESDLFEIVFDGVIAASQRFVSRAVNLSPFEDDDSIARNAGLVEEFAGDLGFGSIKVGVVAGLAHQDDRREFLIVEFHGELGSMIEAAD